MTLSTIEAKYYAFTKTAKEIMWVRNLLTELGVQDRKPTLYFVTTKTL
jgi:hypothetical protein